MSKRKMNRLIIGAVAVSACLGSMSCSSRPSTSTDATEREEQLMIVGTYTDAGSRGIYSFRFNQLTAEWQPLDSA